jgi:histidinol phosphatase-like enzyme
MVNYDLPNYYIYIQNIINMPCGNFLLCHVSQSQTIINNHNGWWSKYFEEKKSKNLHNAMWQILIDGWQLITSIWHHGCSYNGVV